MSGGAPPRLALLTGGSRGLGAALAAGLRARGWRVIALSRTRPDGDTADWIAADLARPVGAAGALAAALAGLDARAPRALHLIHNAGTVEPLGPVARQDAAALVAGLNVNMVSGIALLSTAMAHFRDTPGRKVVAQISSGAGLRAHAGLAAYGASKAGMDHFMRVLAAEQAGEPHPFVPMSIDPGALDTGMQAALRGASPGDYPAAAEFARRHREGALGQVEAVAAQVIAILDDAGVAPGARVHVRDRA